MVLHDVIEDAGRPRRLRVPQPLRPHVRRRVHRDVDGDQGAAALGLRDACRRLLDRALGARLLPAEAAERRHGRVLPDTVDRLEVHLPGGAEGRDRRGRRRVPLRHEGLPHGRQGVPPAAGLRDDRPPVRARRAPARRRSRGPCSRWSRWAPTACTTGSGSTWIPSTASTSPGNAVRDARSSTTTGTSTGCSESSSSTRTRTRSSSCSRTTARSGSTAGSGSTSGSVARVARDARASRTASPRCATSASTGRRRRRGARAATTRASS